ncbi:MAG: Flp pilus assembly protein CpaB, partial [Pseudomonadota bacterium]
LAIDQAGTVGPDGTAIVGETATLELSPEDARTLVAAQSEGILTLVLRAAGDMTETGPPPEPEVDEIEAAAQEAEAAAAAAAQVEPVAPVVEKPPRAVRVIRNGSAQSYEVN